MKKAPDLRIPFTWSERHPVLLEKCLYIPGFYSEHEKWERVPWIQLSGRSGPVFIEYCSGNGQWIAEKAKLYPDVLWVAVEKRFDRAKKIWARIHRQQIENLFVVCGDAHVFNRHYAPLDSVKEIFVNFPDPWPKRRHAENRIVKRKFLEELSLIVCKGGKATFVTDDPECRDNMINEASLCPFWQNEFQSPGYITSWPDYGDSFFRELWLSKGKTIYFQKYNHV